MGWTSQMIAITTLGSKPSKSLKLMLKRTISKKRRQPDLAEPESIKNWDRWNMPTATSKWEVLKWWVTSHILISKDHHKQDWWQTSSSKPWAADPLA